MRFLQTTRLFYIVYTIYTFFDSVDIGLSRKICIIRTCCYVVNVSDSICRV